MGFNSGFKGLTIRNEIKEYDKLRSYIFRFICATVTLIVEWVEQRGEWNIFTREDVCDVSMCLGKREVAYSISVVGGTPRRQAFSIKCRISYLWHACGAFQVGVFSKQELSHSLRCSEHIIMESNSRLRPRGCITTDVLLETTIISRRHKTNLRPLYSSL